MKNTISLPKHFHYYFVESLIIFNFLHVKYFKNAVMKKER